MKLGPGKSPEALQLVVRSCRKQQAGIIAETFHRDFIDRFIGEFHVRSIEARVIVIYFEMVKLEPPAQLYFQEFVRGAEKITIAKIHCEHVKRLRSDRKSTRLNSSHIPLSRMP